MALGPRIDSIVAGLDVQLVRLLRQAMSPVDTAAGRPGPCADARPLSPSSRARFQPALAIAPRPRIHPTPLIEPRPVVTPKPAERIAVTVVPCEAEKPRVAHNPIEPPWKVLPWQNRPPPAPKIKVVVKPPDVPVKGTVFDVFV